jgi:hypothetical protein
MSTQKFGRSAVSFVLCLFSLTVFGCVTVPPAPTSQPVTIQTIPNGADISIQGNYIGKSPLVHTSPAIANEPMKIEAVLKGYETKTVSFGDFHPEISSIRQDLFGNPLRGVPADITPAYYTFRNAITILLQPSK